MTEFEMAHLYLFWPHKSTSWTKVKAFPLPM